MLVSTQASSRRVGVLCMCLLLAAYCRSALGQNAPAQEHPDEHAPVPVDAMRQRILAHLKLRPGMRVAEIGLGRGWFVFRAAEAVGPKGVVYATDIDPQAIEAMRQELPHINPKAGRVDLRLCRDGRDTALDDLPPGHVDIILMVDSLCFDGHEPRAVDLDYLKRFLRILRPGGRLVHHMDCQCNATLESLGAQFADAGFSPHVEKLDVLPNPASIDASWRCQTEAARQRQAVVAVFRKPGTK